MTVIYYSFSEHFQVAVAQWLARRTAEQVLRGSKPVVDATFKTYCLPVTRNLKLKYYNYSACFRQLVALWLPPLSSNGEVPGSIPVADTTPHHPKQSLHHSFVP